VSPVIGTTRASPSARSAPSAAPLAPALGNSRLASGFRTNVKSLLLPRTDAGVFAQVIAVTIVLAVSEGDARDSRTIALSSLVSWSVSVT
jgi:hypothetical protein